MIMKKHANQVNSIFFSSPVDPETSEQPNLVLLDIFLCLLWVIVSGNMNEDGSGPIFFCRNGGSPRNYVPFQNLLSDFSKVKDFHFFYRFWFFTILARYLPVKTKKSEKNRQKFFFRFFQVFVKNNVFWRFQIFFSFFRFHR